MKVLALDIGDKHTGVAISDALGFIAKPLTTVPSATLSAYIQDILSKEKIATIIIGYPKTMRGTSSEQTKKVEATKEALEKEFPAITWKFWDERMTSQQAARIKKIENKADKLHSHAIAAALILAGYLDSTNL